MAEAAEENNDAGQEEKKSKKSLFIMIGLAVLMSGLSVGLTLFLVGGKEAPPASEVAEGEEKVVEVKAELVYLPLGTEFIINLSGEGAHHLQVEMELLARGDDARDVFEQFLPMIRNNILLLLSGQSQASLETKEGKIALKEASKQAVLEAIGDVEAEFVLEDVLFTSFVMQ